VYVYIVSSDQGGAFSIQTSVNLFRLLTQAELSVQRHRAQFECTEAAAAEVRESRPNSCGCEFCSYIAYRVVYYKTSLVPRSTLYTVLCYYIASLTLCKEYTN